MLLPLNEWAVKFLLSIKVSYFNMDRIIDSSGIQLKKYFDNSDINGAANAIRHLRNLLTNDSGNRTAEYIISKLFDESYTILRFLDEIYIDAKWREILKQGLELLDYLYNNYYDIMKMYGLSTLKLCFKISFADAPANDRSKAINLTGIILSKNRGIQYEYVAILYNKFYEYAKIKLTTSSTTVHRSCLNLLGVIAREYPTVINNSNELVNMYLNHLRQQSEFAKDKMLISGCFQGLDDIFQNFPLDADNVNTCRTFYEILEKLLKGKHEFDLRDGLIFLSNHINIFAKYMYADSCEKWHKIFLNWLNSTDINRKAGYKATEAFYIEIAKVLETKTMEEDREVLNYFIEYFLKVLENETASNTEARLTIRGLGKFSAPCAVHKSKHELSQMLYTIVKYIGEAYYVKDEPNIEQLEFLPDYIQCFSSILHQIGEYSFDHIDSLQQVSVIMIKNFPKLSEFYYNSVFESLGTTMYYVYKYKPQCLKGYLEIVVYQGIVWTCSHNLTFEAEIQKENVKNVVTYKNYLPLWKSLLNPRVAGVDMTLEDKNTIARYVYDELLKNLFLLINKLNLNMQRKHDSDFTDPELNYEMEKVPDLIMFINIVDLYVDLLPYNSNDYFKKWIKRYIDQIILKSSLFPWISGFYKLLKACLQICDKMHYFDEEELEKENRNKSYKTLCKFLEDVIIKVQEYKFDLQLSCLELILSVPTSFVRPLLVIMPTIFQISFTIGRGYLKIADTAVSTLEKWYKNIPVEDLKPLLKIVLPYLDPFLRSKGYAGDPDIKIPLLQGRRSKQSKSKRKVYIESESELLTLQKKILMFIGQLNTELLMYLVENNGNVENVTWDKQPLLKYGVPFADVKPSIYLDKLVPRVIELALSSGDQKTRVTACELLHAIIIFMLGINREISGMVSKQSEMKKLFREVIPAALQLGCDPNEIVKQLFNPLVFQLVRWYANPIQLMSSETTILIDILMEGISHSTNTAIRDLSGRCIKEFVEWTIKQTSREQLTNSANIESILNKICLYCEHPNSFKRLGAALAFNQIYRHLREEEALINIYWIELTYSFLINMSLQETKVSNFHSTYIDQALDHIERVLKEKRCLFNENDVRRKHPSVFNTPTLKDIVLWILQQSGTTNMYYRQKCIKLFCNLVPYIEEGTTVKMFLSKHFEQEDWFLEIYENNGIAQMPTLYSCETSGNINILKKWLQNLFCSLDAYKFLLEHDIIADGKFLQKCRINTALLYFIQYVSRSKLESTIQLFQQYDKDVTYITTDEEEFRQQKCSVVLDILDFLCSVTRKNTDWCRSFCTEYVWNFLSDCVFQPNIFGFGAIYKEDIENLNKKIINLFNIFEHKLPGHYLNQLRDILSEYFNKNYDTNITFKTTFIPAAQRQLVTGILLLSQCNIERKLIDVSNYFADSTKIIFDSLITDSKTGIVFPATVQEFAELHLKLSFKYCDQTFLVEYLSCKTPITHPENYTKLTHGEYFLNCFKDIIIEYILTHIFETVSGLCDKWATFSDNTRLLIIINILKHLDENRRINTELASFIMSASRKFYTSSNVTFNDRKFQVEYTTHILRIHNNKQYIIGDKFPFLKSWFKEQLDYNSYELQLRNLLQFKINVLSLLPSVTGPDDDTYNLLEYFVDNILSTVKNQPNDLNNSDLAGLFKKLLGFLITSKSRVVLRCLVLLFLNLKINYDDINIEGVLHLYMSQLKPDQQYKSIRLIYSESFKTNHSYIGRYKLAKVFLTVLMRISLYETFEKFYIENIKDIKECLSTADNFDNVELIVCKNINFLVVEIIFARLDLDAHPCPAICETSSGNDPKKVRNELIIIAMTALKQNCEITNSESEHYRLYYCSAFNALVSVVCNAQKGNVTDNHVSRLLLNPEYNWKNLIDCSKSICIPQDFDSLPSRKKIFANIRCKKEQHTSKYVKYIESQNLFNSTLSEDVCKFDFTNNFLRNTEDVKISKDYTEYNINIESVDINEHECMAEFCGMIDYIAKNVKEESALPNWMAALKNLLDSNVEKNIRIFFARVVHNMHHIFKHYAKYFFKSIANFILDKCTGTSINYFVADLVLMLISWSEDISVIEFKDTISKLIRFLIENVHNDRRDMLKYNIEIIKTVVEIWRDIIEVPYDILSSKFKSESTEVQAILNVLGVLLANDILPFLITDRKHFTNILLSMLKTKLYKPAAEVIGMLLKKLSSNTDWKTDFDSLYETVKKTLKILKDNVFLHCLEQIQMHYPFIIKKELRKLYLIIDSLTDPSLLCINLKNILRIEDDTPELTSKQFQNFLNNTDNDVRLLTIQILNKSVNKLKSEVLLNSIKTACSHKFDKNIMIRCAVYDLCITVYKKFNKQCDEEIFKICKAILLSGLLDSDLELQEKLEDFWYNEQYSNLTLVDRYITSVNHLYSPDTELYYLGCSNYFLLEGCKNSPEYNKLIFDNALSDCKFDELKLLINWRMQNASFRHMFVNTLMPESSRHLTNVPYLAGVKATMTPKAFAPTLYSAVQSSTSLMFDVSTKSFSNFLTKNDKEDNERQKEQRSNHIPHSRRFLKSKGKISMVFAKREVEKKKKIEEFERDRSKMKAANVVMYREYRTGELPDVQIPNSAIIKPLQILAKRDNIIARQFYVMLFNSLLLELKDSSEFIVNFNKGINSIFDLTYMYVPNVIGAFLDILFECNRRNMGIKLFVEPNILSTLCKNSGLNPIGCLLLEDYLNVSEEGVSDPKKGSGNENQSVNHWVKLADMYRELNEWDTVTGIFCSKHMSYSENISKAIQAEANGLWRQAYTEYNNLLKIDFNVDRKVFYYESCFNCYANLSEWQLISNQIDAEVYNMWDNDWKQETLLPRFITAEVVNTLENRNKSRILNLLNSWTTDNDKSEYLKDRFSEELAMFALLQNNLNSSKYYISISFSKFLEDWSNLNPLFSKTRLNKLLNFQKTIDLKTYITFSEDTEKLLNYWGKACDFSTNSIVISEIRTVYRKQLLTALEEKLTAQNELEEYENKLHKQNRLIYMNLIKSSLDKSNHFVARKYLKKSSAFRNSSRTEKLMISIEASKILLLSADTQTGENKTECLFKAWQNLDENFKIHNDVPVDLRLQNALQIFKITQHIKALEDNPNLLSRHSKFLSSHTEMKHTLNYEDISNFGVETLKRGIITGEQSINNSDFSSIKQTLMEAYETLILFALNEENTDYHSIILKYVLRAMKYGSKVAKQLFSYLLQMPELSSSMLETFKMEVASVPTWMFLSWIPQLLASINSENIHATYNILIDIAKKYPQALMYAYRLSSERSHMLVENETRNDLIEKLNSLLNKTFIDKLFEELSMISIPELYINYHLDKISKVADITEMKYKIRNLTTDLHKKMNLSKNFKSIENCVQNLEDISQKFSDIETLKYHIEILSRKMKNVDESKKKGKYLHLKEYSRWLANYRASNKNFELEVPGQYSGNCKPMINYHVKISSFHPHVTLLSSQRKPFKITFLGNDFKEYPFLIKFGEDLRQDQRIQQLFELVNDILQNDLQCRQRNLHLETYQVIPLTSNMGLIKWVENTKSFNVFLDEAVEAEYNSNEIKLILVRYQEWLQCASGRVDNITEMYANACMKYTKEQVVTKFSEFVYTVPFDILSKAFLNISLKLESYVSLRQQFIVSYSTMCIVHWLLGIGDRHLENSLVLQRSGKVVGIDFGLAFGAATQNLSVPELIPFRLTPHILNLTGPLKEIGLIEYTMIHCLRALRKNKHIFLSTMNVFIQDPVIDWLEFAKSSRYESFSSPNWTPNQKIYCARRKLLGANPKSITEEELKSGCLQDIPEFLYAYLKIVAGDNSNIRSLLPADGLTEEDQVKCLLDQATDFNILGRMYKGLQLWF